MYWVFCLFVVITCNDALFFLFLGGGGGGGGEGQNSLFSPPSCFKTVKVHQKSICSSHCAWELSFFENLSFFSVSDFEFEFVTSPNFNKSPLQCRMCLRAPQIEDESFEQSTTTFTRNLSELSNHSKAIFITPNRHHLPTRPP